MAIWIQSLSWTLIYSFAQGFAAFTTLWLLFKLVPGIPANGRYHMSLSTLTALLGLFIATWWQQFHLLMSPATGTVSANTTVVWLPGWQHQLLEKAGNMNLPGQFFPLLCACYVAGFTFMLIRLAAGMLQLFSLRRKGVVQIDASMHALFGEQQRRIGLSKPVQLLVSANAKVPMVIGFLKPVILMPTAALTHMEPRQLETILLHELAHIKRHDYLVNILQTIAETVLFFNPFVWLINNWIRREREHCCDDMVLAHITDPLPYATALATLAAKPALGSAVMVAATGETTHLYQRILRIMETRKSPFSYSRMVAAIILVLIIAGSVAWIKPVFPGAKKNKPGASAVTHKATKDNTRADKNIESENESKAATEDIKKAVVITPTVPVKESAPPAAPEENQLVQRLLDDGLVDQVRGFTVEKQLDKLFINGQQQPDDVANKYLSALKKPYMKMQVFSLEKRMQMHPGSDFLQLLLPYSFESPCIEKKTTREGC